MTVLPAPACPTCRAELSLQADHELDAWVCPRGHGLAFTLSEAYVRLQDDEIHEVWRRAQQSRRGERGCPMCAATMLTVSVTPDDDETRGNDPAAGAPVVQIDVCLVDEVLWLDAGELAELPVDLPDPEPTAAETAALHELTEDFGDTLTAGWDAQEQATLTGRLTNRLLRTFRGATTT